MIQVASYNFKLDEDRYINILTDDAKRLYEELHESQMFGIKIPINKDTIILNIFCEVKLFSSQQFDITLHQLKELYYLLDDMFAKTTNTR